MLKKTLSAALAALTVFLVGCTARPAAQTGADFGNPLYAEWYYKDLVEDMMNMEIQKDPIVQDASKKAIIDATRQSALKQSNDATSRKQQGLLGHFVSVFESVNGQALLLGDTLYLGPDFQGVPGPDLHVYVTTVADPREVKFPDPTAVDLGSLQTPYGAQSYQLPAHAKDLVFRSVVLWDNKLSRFYGFAQIQPQK